jgi:prepilin-type N-terminal cleavage/methylation domain-containing protein
MNRQSGFTIIELMITVILIAVVAAVAVPSFRTMVQNNRIATQANTFITAINLARSEAVKRGRDVYLSSTSGTVVWGDGWRLWVDENGNGSEDAGELLRVFEALEGGSTLTSVNGHTAVRYLANGYIFLANAGDPVPTFALRIPNCTGDSARDIEINLVGRPSVTRVNC